MDILAKLSEELSIPQSKVEAAVALLDDGNTVPFIARYRKEVTGSLDDGQLRDLEERLHYLRSFETRKNEIYNAIDTQGKMTPEIAAALDGAKTLTELEDIYRPYKQKRRTRASVAREKGLEDLALTLLMQEECTADEINEKASGFINEELGVENIEQALDGACDIIAEDVSDNAEYRRELRALTHDYARIITEKLELKDADDKKRREGETYAMYFDYNEKISDMPPHRILAINRAEKEGFIRVSLDMPSDIALNYLVPQVVTNPSSPAASYVSRAVVDSYDRLIAPSIEREIRSDRFDEAAEGAIKVFAENLRGLLMQAPVKGMTVLGYDPGYRTGCKLAVVDKTGLVLDTAVIYPTKPQERIEESKRIVKNLIRKHKIDVVAIGNGTASRESEQFIASLIREIPENVKYVIVSEAGASVYSASKEGAEEFPDFDVTQRSAVSIARRLQDPLAELIKVDPKAIGVGQYQHDMKPARLDEALDGVVEECVNAVGVDLNTASRQLLSHVAGLNATSAKNIVKYRDENGEFESRADVKKVPRVGDKAYEQCAGFLRVRESEEILDNTGVHPESYGVARALLKKFDYKGEDVKANKLSGLMASCERYGIAKLCDELQVGEPTLRDIITELEKPGRDVRDSLTPPELRTDVLDIEDLKPDMLLTGTVRNVIDFGAFVDIGVHQDGLVHISQISEKYIKHPSEALSVGDVVKVRVLSVDLDRKRIALTMKI